MIYIFDAYGNLFMRFFFFFLSFFCIPVTFHSRANDGWCCVKYIYDFQFSIFMTIRVPSPFFMIFLQNFLFHFEIRCFYQEENSQKRHTISTGTDSGLFTPNLNHNELLRMVLSLSFSSPQILDRSALFYAYTLLYCSIVTHAKKKCVELRHEFVCVFGVFFSLPMFPYDVDTLFSGRQMRMRSHYLTERKIFGKS